MKKMKKLLTIFLMMLFCLFMAIAFVACTPPWSHENSSQETSVQEEPKGVLYRISQNRAYAEVYGYEGTDTAVVIADTYEGKPVEVILEYAFYEVETLKSVVISSSVHTVESCAFYSCKALESVTFSDSVVLIEPQPFVWCYALTNIQVSENNPNYTSLDGSLYTKDQTTLVQYAIGKMDDKFNVPDSVWHIGDYAFKDSLDLRTVIFPDGMRSIGAYAFYMCTDLKQAELPASLTQIGVSAFYWCDLSSITIPNSIFSIGSNAFRGCDRLTEVYIPASVTAINGAIFSECTRLMNIEVDSKNEKYQSIDGNLYLKNQNILLQYACGKKDESFTIPDFVTSICDGAFHGCGSLKSVILSESVTSIGSWAFADCSRLIEINILDGVSSINNHAFASCSSLTTITLPESVTSIGYGAFIECSALTSVTIPVSVTSIGEHAFSWCSSLTELTFEGSVAQWEVIAKAANWNENMPIEKVICIDGDVVI